MSKYQFTEQFKEKIQCITIRISFGIMGTILGILVLSLLYIIIKPIIN